MQHITLNNGITMPSIGLGTYELCGQKRYRDNAKYPANWLQIL
ncbi:hypothetical protein CUPS4256_08910 [Campylobacter upsaliensis]|nr:hypothetical protein [Campylobacter upsaliensis]MCR2103359.1 hypothetical protein [Campylobacter upsaliensis]